MANSYYHSTDNSKLFLRSLESDTLLKYTCRNMLHKIRQLIKKNSHALIWANDHDTQKTFPCTLRFKLVCAIRYRYDMFIRNGSNVKISLY